MSLPAQLVLVVFYLLYGDFWKKKNQNKTTTATITKNPNGSAPVSFNPSAITGCQSDDNGRVIDGAKCSIGYLEMFSMGLNICV